MLKPVIKNNDIRSKKLHCFVRAAGFSLINDNRNTLQLRCKKGRLISGKDCLSAFLLSVADNLKTL